MSDELTPRERRRAQTTDEIVAAAWRLARRDGLAAISMRDLGAEVGLKAQSLYAYFDSKAALYDAMFLEAHRLLEKLTAGWPAEATAAEDARAVAKVLTRRFADFCNEDPIRYQLLYQRVVPDWEPSQEAYQLAVDQLNQLREFLALIGIETERAVDLWTAMITGLTSQQISNDPGGHRWIDLVDDAVDMYMNHFGLE